MLRYTTCKALNKVRFSYLQRVASVYRAVVHRQRKVCNQGTRSQIAKRVIGDHELTALLHERRQSLPSD